MTPSTEELIRWHQQQVGIAESSVRLMAMVNDVERGVGSARRKAKYAATVAALRRLQAFERAEVVEITVPMVNGAVVAYHKGDGYSSHQATFTENDRVLIVRGINETTT